MKKQLMPFLAFIAVLIGTPPLVLNGAEPVSSKVKHVILISVDGLRPDALTTLGPQQAHHFYQLIQEGSSTLNARTDPDFTITLPNHISMATGRPVKGDQGHHYTANTTTQRNIHEFKGEFVKSIFDVAHEAGYKTAMMAAKDKFAIFAMSYGSQLIEIKRKPRIPGSQSLDIFKYSDSNDEALLDYFEPVYLKNRPALTFLHLSGPDNVGHTFEWDVKKESIYLKQVIRDDRLIGRVLDIIQNDRELSKSTIIILTADHGGSGRDHGDAHARINYTIPFIIWGPGVTAGADLYKLNTDTRHDPGESQIPVEASQTQPIRNSDAANLALSFLGLPAIPGSVINKSQDLRY